jgi:Fe-S-cluster containining protein
MLNAVLTDLAGICRLTAAHQAENLAFQRHLNSHPFPERPFRVLCRTVEKQIDCKACANCCRETQVNLSDRDIAAVARYLGIEPGDVIHQYTIPDPDDSTARILRHTKDGCAFLDGNTCMVYEARPGACRDFPYLASNSRSLGSRIPSVFKRASFCPIVYNMLENYKKLVGYHPH